MIAVDAAGIVAVVFVINAPNPVAETTSSTASFCERINNSLSIAVS